MWAGLGNIDLNAATIQWLKGAKGLFYAFHGYVNSPEDAVRGAKRFAAAHGDMAALMTEYANNEKGCHLQRVLNEAGIGHAYWHYSNYCNTAGCGSCTADRVANGTFGACITGWGSGNSSYFWTPAELRRC